MNRKTLKQKLQKYRVDQAGCWIWTGNKAAYGYGRVRHDGKKVNVHRAMMMELGHDVAGFHVHHKCEVKLCINPDHLEVVENMAHQDLHNHRKVDPPCGKCGTRKRRWKSVKTKTGRQKYQWKCPECQRKRIREMRRKRSI